VALDAPQVGGDAEVRKAAWLLPFLVLLAHALLFGGWIVDDAGISFVYARNLAAGHGLVSQPGLSPVEGFSNFLWTIGLVPAFWLGLFHPVFTPKAVSLALLAGSFLLLDRAFGKRAISLVALLLLAVCTPFVVWTVSGLENPLYAFLLCLLLWLAVRERENGGAHPLAAGAVAATIAMTRPDGLVFAGLYPLLTLATRSAPARLLRYAAAFLLLFGGFLLFRRSYFGDLFPNTYYAKGGASPPTLGRVFSLFESVAGTGGLLLLAALVAGTGLLIHYRRFGWRHGLLLAFAGFGAVPYLLLPKDWMPELRFATPFFPFFYAYGVTLAADLGEVLVPDPRRRRLPAVVASLAAVGLSLALFIPRSRELAQAPTVPFQEVAEKFGERYNRFADRLGLEQASILLPDVGGTLWVSRLRVYDLVGLTDRTIARTLEKDRQAFYDHVFGQVKPTFIHLHHYWTYLAGLDRDPRFARDYEPLYLYPEKVVDGRAKGSVLRSGDFVRRDVIRGKDAAVAEIRAELAADYRRRAEAERRTLSRRLE
jgi:hypothetical protein